MAHSQGKALAQWMIGALLFAMLAGSLAVQICNIDPNDLKQSCSKFVTGRNPPRADEACCGVLRRANLPCLCGYKSALTYYGINAKKALALPGQCGLQTPSNC
ncbi:putative bifunctional inhibitor/plant lipid transfer protein/seed storage helical [Medicago truncatula]|uniref:Lipid transfer protein n=1 Tax=Medicago truncatula TaxID=3880 RepID=O24101_MEDTR|nr:Lipid transfer protein [Medicago truncatula]AFK43841.1 unknown [Medicago truncatula]RHN57876.1 putative bifunctional inhibitor/plant lipid transfer protein/seed storage helical [Medicago truncatula]CAA75593.1 MtN5 [Medicago truncatula]